MGTNAAFGGALEQQLEQFKRDRVYKRLNYRRGYGWKVAATF